MTTKQMRDHVSQQCGFTPNKAKSMDEFDPLLAAYNNGDGNQQGTVPESFEDWLKQGNDSIDIGGNVLPDRVAANHDRYDNERHPFQ